MEEHSNYFISVVHRLWDFTNQEKKSSQILRTDKSYRFLFILKGTFLKNDQILLSLFLIVTNYDPKN